jgi:N-methylhydantoinase A/oxoprolinase/acetone carboxylase beta subunit
MKLGIGIDTGGTYTDAVVYSFADKTVLDSAKALTTKEDLSRGILAALGRLDPALLKQADVAALSTTLATNACVEGKGSRARLLFIGQDGETMERVGAVYGITDPGDVYPCPGSGTYDGKVLPDPDWDSILAGAKDWLGQAEGLGIVEKYAMNNGAVAEKEAKRRFRELTDVPIVCGSELFSGLDSVQRASGTLLNARLVPIIREFLDAIRRAFTAMGITAPIVVVRSDGSLMNERFSRLRPVETILCGPAASVLGGMELAGRPDSVIVDMGGTTTDVSLVKGGLPVRVRDGIRIGGWRTFVKGVLIDTFGLGGDSAVRLDKGRLSLYADRVLPISLLAQQYPRVLEDLRTLVEGKITHTRPIHEYYTLVRDISGLPGWTEAEQDFCRALKDGPLPIREAAAAMDTDIYKLQVSRLEREGVVLRSGLTPTDIMHLKGDFTLYDPEAARLAVCFLLQCMGRKITAAEQERFCTQVYDMVKKKLYCNLVRILLQDRYPSLSNGLGHELTELVSSRWEDIRSGRDDGYFDPALVTRATLVGIGAPIHIFLPDVAKALGTDCFIPPNAGVANAVGAVVGNVAAAVEVEIRPNHTPEGIQGFYVCSTEANVRVRTRPEAEKLARETAARLAEAEARDRGVLGDIRIEVEMEDSTGLATKSRTVDLGSRVTATARGGMIL